MLQAIFSLLTLDTAAADAGHDVFTQEDKYKEQRGGDEAHSMITNGLRNAFTETSGDVNYPVQMAAVAIVSAPLFLVFIFLRKYIMSGVSRSGIKG